ncbi:MAG: peptidoglycan DD-metalloendopeptidase family protein [Methylococcaceae bacterium]|nr:peptidoglycan DD-metalloendopeptidase family protein [Prolixibacteraceae bacterium]
MKLHIPERYRTITRIVIWSVAFIALLQVAYFVFDMYQTRLIEKELSTQKEEVKPEPIMLFDIQVDSFNVVSDQVRPGQNLSDLLNGKGMDMTRVDEISKKMSAVFDVRKMKVDNPYYFFMNKKQPSKVEYFIYEINAVDYVVCQFGDSIRVYRDKKPMVTQIKTASGVITSSLYKDMEAQALNIKLTHDLSEIYQWTIDFFDIKKGDKFKVIYEEFFVYGKSIGTGRIYAAQFTHNKEDFYAFSYTQDNEDRFFDEKGKSMKTAFLKAPLKFSRISSMFSNSRFHPVLKIRRPHHGVDYAAPTGTPVYSIGDGTVIAKAYQPAGGGNYLKVKHNATYTTSYMHLKGFAQGIGVGVHVKQGQTIGYVGATGLASGPHLDFRVFQNGTPIDPLSLKSPKSDPINANLMKEFSVHRDSLMTRLQKL